MSSVKCESCDGTGSMGIVRAISFRQGWRNFDNDRTIQLEADAKAGAEIPGADYLKLMAETERIWKAACKLLDQLEAKGD